MTACVIIPARFGSSRYPGKPLAMVAGAGGRRRPLIERSWLAAMAADIGPVFVATDDRRIADCVRGFGGEAIMTSENCANGTERCAAALEALCPDIDVVVNFQGDALLTPPWFLAPLTRTLRDMPDIDVATPVIRAPHDVHARLLEDAACGRVGGTTVVADNKGRALYFTKAVIPHVSKLGGIGSESPILLHVGIYAYRCAALRRYGALPVPKIEELEGLEQLRFLSAGIPVQLVEVEPRGRPIWELNNPSDHEPIEAALAANGIA